MHEGKMRIFLTEDFSNPLKISCSFGIPEGRQASGERKRRSLRECHHEKISGSCFRKFVAIISLFSEELNLTKTTSVPVLSLKRWPSLSIRIISRYFLKFFEMI